jgi:hypothetical protein
MAKKNTGEVAAAKAKSEPQLKARYDEEKAKVWGSPDYLMARYDDVQSAEELSRKCKATKAVKDAVKALRTDKDNMQVHSVVRTVICVPGEEPHEGIVAQVGVGLNGAGRQSDYLDALKRLVKSGEFRIFDAFVDAVDDLADVLVSYGKPAKKGA